MAIKAMLLLISIVILTTANAACWREGLFECSNGQKCLNGNKICDGYRDCEDQSDEANCTQANCNAYLAYYNTSVTNMTKAEMDQSVMPEGYYPRFACTDGETCVPEKAVCDATVHCNDGSDEDNCLDRCPPTYFPCADGTRCIERKEVCDGRPQCEDESDEGDCTDEKCGQGRFRCDDGSKCIDQNGVCDGNSKGWISSCDDGSDESDCKDKCPKAFRFPCDSGTVSCVDFPRVCDGRSHCDDGSDEMNCDAVKCTSLTKGNTVDGNFQFDRVPCDDKSKCVPTNQICDGDPQCDDGSDETNCTQERCGKYRTVCKGGSKCIWVPSICNGNKDCPEGDDEGDCDQQRCQQALGAGKITIRSDFTTCEGGSNCISRFEVCDGETQDGFCPTGTDEENCEVDECSTIDPCNHNGVCVDVKAGYRCDCPTGWSGQDCDDPG